jgi:hypothetical protein
MTPSGSMPINVPMNHGPFPVTNGVVSGSKP